jgi:transcriptional regulator with XRE-family HTH domain
MSTFAIEAPFSIPVPEPLPYRSVVSRFGTRMRALRHARGWTQAQMATILGIDRSYISEVERGNKSISLPMLEIIALGFRMSLSDLLAGI